MTTTRNGDGPSEARQATLPPEPAERMGGPASPGSAGRPAERSGAYQGAMPADQEERAPTSDSSEVFVPGSELPRFAGNALWLMSGEAVGKVASFLFVVIVARGLGAAQYGYFNFALSFMPLFLMLGADGIEFTLIREIARDKTRLSELFVTGLVLRVGLGLIALASSIALTRFLIRETNAV